MHLLATTSGVIDGAAEAVDLGQSPASLIVLSAADSELASLARAHDRDPCSLRLANLLQLQHPLLQHHPQLQRSQAPPHPRSLPQLAQPPEPPAC